MDADPRHPEHLLPYRRQRLLRRRAGRGIRRMGHGCIRLRQRFEIDFAVGGQRQLLQLHEGGRNHIRWQRRGQQAAQLRKIQFAANDIGTQLEAARSIRQRGHDSFAYPGQLQQLGFDLARFDPVAPDLHLSVHPAHVLEIAVRQPARQVPGPVEPLIWLERAGDESLGRQLRLIEIPTGQSRPADAQLPRYPDRLQLSIRIQHINFRLANGSAERMRLPRIDHQQSGRHHAVFRRSIFADKLDLMVSQHLFDQRRTDFLPAGDHAPYGNQLFRLDHLQQCREQNRWELRVGNLLLGKRADDGLRIA
ncbi:hypothetical protein PMJ11TS3_45950 [Paenibacillus melissococcoides]